MVVEGHYGWKAFRWSLFLLPVSCLLFWLALMLTQPEWSDDSPKGIFLTILPWWLRSFICFALACLVAFLSIILMYRGIAGTLAHRIDEFGIRSMPIFLGRDSKVKWDDIESVQIQ